MRSDLRAALGEGRGVTAKIRWLTRADKDGEGEGRPRWIHCTPLFGHSGAVGVWMVILVDDEVAAANNSGRRFRAAPPVATNIGGKEWEPPMSSGNSSAARERRQQYEPEPMPERKGMLRLESGESVSRTNSQSTARPGRAMGSSPSQRDLQYGVASGDVSEFSFQLK